MDGFRTCPQLLCHDALGLSENAPAGRLATRHIGSNRSCARPRLRVTSGRFSVRRQGVMISPSRAWSAFWSAFRPVTGRNVTSPTNPVSLNHARFGRVVT
jgi:hypothetical protein